jgi:hypothetical protein
MATTSEKEQVPASFTLDSQAYARLDAFRGKILDRSDHRNL